MWRPEDLEGSRPKVLSTASVVIALLLHLVFFLLCYLFAVFHFKDDEKIIPIDLTVVVVENLDGDPDEPPPLKPPEPEPPPPPPPPKPKPRPKEPEKPKELEKIVTNIVEKLEKKEEPKKPEPPPKKTAKELRDERIKRIRDAAKDTKQRPKTQPSPPQPNGRTDRKTLSDAEIQKLLNAGYKPGRSTNLAASEEQLCFSLIKQAFEEKWDKPPWTDTLRPMVIRVWFGGGGRIVNYRLEQSSSDSKADATIKSAASRVGVVRNLTAGFIEKYRDKGVPIEFRVTPK